MSDSRPHLYIVPNTIITPGVPCDVFEGGIFKLVVSWAQVDFLAQYEVAYVVN